MFTLHQYSAGEGNRSWLSVVPRAYIVSKEHLSLHHHSGDFMRLILKEISFKFNDKHYLQTHGIAMGTKMDIAVIFMAHTEKQLLATSPHKPPIWKRLIDDIFSVWTSTKAEINNVIDFANSFHTTIKFIHELLSENIVFLDTVVFRGPRFITDKILDVQNMLSRIKRSNTCTSPRVTLSA